MKKALLLVLALVLVISLAACGGNGGSNTGGNNSANPPASQGGNNSAGGAQQIITADQTTGVGSMARDQYYAETVREEFAFDKDGILTGYKKIYTFENGTNDEQKQDALDTLLDGNFTASIDGNTIVIDGNGNYLGFPYSDTDLAYVQSDLDEDGTVYNIGAVGTVSVPASSNNGGEALDINTVEGRLAKAGLKLDDIKPDTFAEASLYNCDKDEIVMYLSNGSDKLGAAVMEPLVMKVLNATAAIADDGKYWDAYYGLGDPKELDLSNSNFDAWNFIAQWSYQAGGQWVTVTLGVLPAEEPEGQDNYSWEVMLSFLY